MTFTVGQFQLPEVREEDIDMHVFDCFATNKLEPGEGLTSWKNLEGLVHIVVFTLRPILEGSFPKRDFE